MVLRRQFHILFVGSSFIHIGLCCFFCDEDMVGHTETTRHHRRKLGTGWSPMASMIHCRQGLMVLCWARSIFMSEAQSPQAFFCFKRKNVHYARLQQPRKTYSKSIWMFPKIVVPPNHPF